MISSLIGRDGVVPCRRLVNRPENATIENDQGEDGDENESQGIGNQDVITGIFWILTKDRWYHSRNHDFVGVIFTSVLVKLSHICRLHFRTEFEKSWNVENYAEKLRQLKQLKHLRSSIVLARVFTSFHKLHSSNACMDPMRYEYSPSQSH
jgi:hypothetical protein